MRLFLADPRTTFPDESYFEEEGPVPAIFSLAARGNNLEMLELLIEDSRVFVMDYFTSFNEDNGIVSKVNALDYAIINRNTQIVEFILESPKWEYIDSENIVTLIEYGNEEIAELLFSSPLFPFNQESRDLIINSRIDWLITGYNTHETTRTLHHTEVIRAELQPLSTEAA